MSLVPRFVHCSNYVIRLSLNYLYSSIPASPFEAQSFQSGDSGSSDNDDEEEDPGSNPGSVSRQNLRRKFEKKKRK